MISVKIIDPTVTSRDVKSSKNGKSYTFFEQQGIAKVRDEIRRIRVPVKDGKSYPPGDYTLSPESFYVDQFGGLSLSLVLVAAK